MPTVGLLHDYTVYAYATVTMSLPTRSVVVDDGGEYSWVSIEEVFLLSELRFIVSSASDVFLRQTPEPRLRLLQ